MKTFTISPHVTIFQSALYQTNTTLIDLEEAVFLCDPSWLPVEIKVIQSAVNNILDNRPLYLIFTHNDYDHIMGAGAFPQATVIASQAFAQARTSEKEYVLAQMKAFDDSYYINRSYPLYYPSVDHVISRNGQQLKIGSAILTFYLAPGHTADGLFTVVDTLGVFLAGDYLSDVEFPFIADDYFAYQNTLTQAKKIITHYQIDALVPGHGTPTQCTKDMLKRVNESIDYLTLLSEESTFLEADLQKRYPFYDSIKDLHQQNKKKLPKK